MFLYAVLYIAHRRTVKLRIVSAHRRTVELRTGSTLGAHRPAELRTGSTLGAHRRTGSAFTGLWLDALITGGVGALCTMCTMCTRRRMPDDFDGDEHESRSTNSDAGDRTHY